MGIVDLLEELKTINVTDEQLKILRQKLEEQKNNQVIITNKLLNNSYSI